MYRSNKKKMQEMISMEEYLERRKQKENTEKKHKTLTEKRAAQWGAALELVQLYV
ncbi:hypothetical protein [Luxibacter massiliensis]|uniref:hypothetical protein n=1 Tax=Luxibacter massiliensis TaxID=2219695 RepID=UPI0013DFDD6D|nr:hypothetical protein [Luxibacter massiliensis]